MNFAEYANIAAGTQANSGYDDWSGMTCHKELMVYALGLTGEAGEVADMIKKHVGHGHKRADDKLLLELGDVLWYIAALANVLGFDLEDVAEANVEKLRKRYPNGFSTEASLARVDECVKPRPTAQTQVSPKLARNKAKVPAQPVAAPLVAATKPRGRAKRDSGRAFRNASSV